MPEGVVRILGFLELEVDVEVAVDVDVASGEGRLWDGIIVSI